MTALLLSLLAVPAVAADSPSAPLLAACAGATYPLPPLTPEQVAQLDAGDVVRIVRPSPDPGEPSTAVGLALLDAPRDDLWVSAQDTHEEVDPSLVELVIRSLGADHALWYGHLDLPKPITDRQWVIESANNHALAPGCWEHHWNEVDGGMALARASVAASPGALAPGLLDDAVALRINRGNWLMAPRADGRTLVAYQVSTEMGGVIPDWLVLRFTMARLEKVLRDLETRARTWVPEHYRGDHEPIPGGDGDPIPLHS